MEKFCNSLTQYERRTACPVRVGGVVVGGGRPVEPQSMADCSTLDTPHAVEQAARVHEAGCGIMRYTVQGPREADALPSLMAGLRTRGLGEMGIVADIHFAPKVALLAAEHVDKVRINPGNFGGPGENFLALIETCRRRGISIRIGVNHGSLAPHIVEKWGDTPRGMVASAMEYLRVCRTEGFDRVVVSMKSSNVRVMVHAYRMLAAAMRGEGMAYPLHLGVTEAGNGMEGRVKSAVGIGALMADGLGDTIRVSLTEPPENEVPVAKQIIDYFSGRESHEPIEPVIDESLYSPYEYRPRHSDVVGNVGGENLPVLWNELDARAAEGVRTGTVAVLEAATENAPAQWRARILNMMAAGDRRPVILTREYDEPRPETLWVKAAADFGMPLIDGLADGIRIVNRNPAVSAEDIRELSLAILQAARVRMSRTEYIACPGCGRTLYDLQGTLAAIKEATGHLPGLKIGVMGCVVNGPGEMADADYGYVGEGPGRITLYKGRTVLRRGIPEAEAIAALVELLREEGRWKERT